jgi:archaellin
MTVFQQMIVFLLLLVVAASLATVLLYTKGWIELPTAVLEVVEKGLALIR